MPCFEFIKNLKPLVSEMKESTASVSAGTSQGVLVKMNEISEVSLGYTLPNYTVLIADDVNDLSNLRSVVTSILLSKEAFDIAYKYNANAPFAGVFRFHNMQKDEVNSTVLHNDVIAIDMGTTINNLTDQITIYFHKGTEKGKPSCRSWNGEGQLPNWTDNGCDTLVNGDSIACRCSHLTFFAVIMSPSDQPISAEDLKSLTYITYIGCGLSVFFLGIAFFMHFLTR
ncbi:hypothetical protein CRUP_000243 [Coryphaenoides rupestris]|nr:hypothetical protein CRUP_000243 [Coryphaenoides rupestris]